MKHLKCVTCGNTVDFLGLQPVRDLRCICGGYLKKFNPKKKKTFTCRFYCGICGKGLPVKKAETISFPAVVVAGEGKGIKFDIGQVFCRYHKDRLRML
jgi:hypothetical protein